MSRSAVTMRLYFFKNEGGSTYFLCFGKSVFPALHECFEFGVELGDFFTFGGSSYYYAEIFWLYTAEKLPEASAFLTGFYFLGTEILSQKGIRTRYRPVREISVVSRGPFDDMGSLTICTSSSCPGESTSAIAPCLSISGRRFFF